MNDIYGDYLSIPDVATSLHLEKSTVWKLVKKGALPAVNIGNGNIKPRWGIHLEDFTAFAAKYKRYACPERSNIMKDAWARRHAKEQKLEKQRRDEEITTLKAQMAEISAALLDMSIRLEELSKS